MSKLDALLEELRLISRLLARLVAKEESRLVFPPPNHEREAAALRRALAKHRAAPRTRGGRNRNPAAQG